MKKLTLLFAIFVGYFLFLGYVNYPRTNSSEYPKFLTNYLTMPSTSNSHWQRSTERNMNDESLFNSSTDMPLWSRTYGDSSNHEKAFWIEQTKDNGYIIGGYTASFGAGYADIWILKLNPLGIIEWQKTYGGNNDEAAYHIQQTNDRGYIVAGFTESFGAGNENFWVLKLSPNGEVEWQKTYGGSNTDIAYSIYQTSDNGYIVCGESNSYGAGGINFWVLKLYSNGEVEWQKIYQESGYARAYCVQQTYDGGYIIGGGLNKAVDWNGRILKISASGDIEWQYEYGEAKKAEGRHTEDIITSIQQTIDKGYIVGAHTFSYGAGYADLWALKLFPDGSIEWQKAYGGQMSEFTQTIQQTDDNGFIALCSTWTFGAGAPNFWVVKLRPNGKVEWQKVYGSYDREQPSYNIQQTNDGGYITAGASSSFRNGSFRQFDFWALKLSSEGEIDPSCNLIQIQSPVFEVIDTTSSPKPSNFITIETNAIPQPTNIFSQNTNDRSNLLCWNLHQPPLNVSLKRETNRGLFRGEAFHTISWDPNPVNSQFGVTGYEVYRRNAEDNKEYQMIGTVPAGTYEYKDGYLELEEILEYVVTSTDADGNESPKSESVRNE